MSVDSPHLPHGVVSDPAWTFQKVRPVTGMVGVEVAIFVTVLVFDAVQGVILGAVVVF